MFDENITFVDMNEEKIISAPECATGSGRPRVAVYCSSRGGLPEGVERGAAMIAESIGKAGADLVYGGVNAGLMHVVAEAAHNAGARVIGVIPEVFIHRADSLCDELIPTSDLNARKGKMIEISDIFIVLPGGVGTIDEWISTLSHIMVYGAAAGKPQPHDETAAGKPQSHADCPIMVWNHAGMYDGMVAQLAATNESVYARGKRVDRSRIFSSAEELSEDLEKSIAGLKER